MRAAFVCPPPRKRRGFLGATRARHLLGVRSARREMPLSYRRLTQEGSAIMHRTLISSRSTLVNERVLCRRRVWKGLLSGLAALCLFLGAVGPARSQFVYWANRSGETIERANLDGTGAVVLVRNQNDPV